MLTKNTTPEPASASTGRMSQDDVMKLMRAAGIPESHCRTLYAGHGLSFTLEHFTKFANTVLSAPVAARELDVEAERREFEAWADDNRYDLTDAWDGWLAARSAAQATQPESAQVSTEQAGDAPRIPRENNDKLIELARYWKLDGDWMTCKGCKRSLIASRDGEELNHADGCKFAAQQHPWARLRALVAPSPNNSPVGADKEPK